VGNKRFLDSEGLEIWTSAAIRFHTFLEIDVEKKEVIMCMFNCDLKLEFQGTNSLGVGMF